MADEEKKETGRNSGAGGDEEAAADDEYRWDIITEQVLEHICGEFPSIERDDDLLKSEPSLIVDSSDSYRVAEALKDNPYSRMNFLRSVTGIERADCFEVAYNLQNIPTGTRICMHVRCPKESPSVPSLTPLWPGADFQEREAYDMFGIEFEGHPDLRRILLDDNFPSHPLRKDYPLHGRLEDIIAISAYVPGKFRERLEQEAKPPGPAEASGPGGE